jgi:hypothetical protein
LDNSNKNLAGEKNPGTSFSRLEYEESLAQARECLKLISETWNDLISDDPEIVNAKIFSSGCMSWTAAKEIVASLWYGVLFRSFENFANFRLILILGHGWRANR